MVRRQIAAAQRTGKLIIFYWRCLTSPRYLLFLFATIDNAHPMVPVGEMSQHLGQINLSGHGGGTLTGTSNKSNLQPYKATTKPTSGIHINLIQQVNSHSTLPFPASLKSKIQALVNPGYQEAHQLYDEMRNYFASKAYSNVANAEVIVVKVWMMMRVPNRKTAAPVSVCNSINVICTGLLKFFTFYQIFSGYFRSSFEHSSPYWSRRSQMGAIFCAPPSIY